jgi:hypothetical protein
MKEIKLLKEYFHLLIEGGVAAERQEQGIIQGIINISSLAF